MSFTVTAPLPAGTSVIEASAGTGKTYAIVALATRALALGDVSPAQLMIVTFTQVATQELRGRVRDRLAHTADALADPAAARASTDDLTRYLADTDDPGVGERRARLVQALSDFDAITIATTHSFCQRMLDSLGLAGHREQYQFQESVSDLLDDVVDDLYLHRYSARTDPPFSLAIARDIAAAVTNEPTAVIAPAKPAADSIAAERVEFAAATRTELARRKTRLALRDYNDLLTLLWQSLSDPANGEQACQLIRDRYRLVLVDEFQDTDPLQWDILRRAFHGHVSLVLVGDPKQAIYAFRGAEVLAYLDAVSVAAQTLTLDTNRRSDPPLLTALENIYGGAALGHPDIIARHVDPADTTANQWTGAAMRVRYLDRSGPWPVSPSTGLPNVAGVRARVARDVADDIAALLNSGLNIGTGADARPVTPGDIAVLVQRRNTQALPVRDELAVAGISTVLLGDAGVFATPSATAWLRLLRGMEQPHRAASVRLAALTPLLGASITGLADDIETHTADYADTLARYTSVYQRAGIAAVYEQITADTGLQGRLLAHEHGERDVTDQRHIAQLLHQAATRHDLGLAGVTEWLSTRIRDAATDTDRTRSRLLDSERDAVRILTIHGAKGLEFPIVYVPFGWDFTQRPADTVYQLHDGSTRILDVGGTDDPGHAARKATARRENNGEQLRNLYVALTRARHHLTIWWAPSGATTYSPLQRLLFGRTPDGTETSPSPPIPADDAIASAFVAWAAPAGTAIATEHVTAVAAEPRTTWQRPARAHPALAAAVFDRQLDYTWRRTSYTALAANAHHPGAVPDPDDYIVTDEPAPSTPAPGTEAAAAATHSPSLLNPFESNASFGTLVHSILEHVDTAATDLQAEVTARVTTAAASRLTFLDVSALATALTAVLRTPVGAAPLAGIAPADRLSELAFELPLGGGDTPTATPAVLRDVADTIREHLDPTDPLAAYPDVLDSIDAAPLRGFLTGSIDSVLRRPGPTFEVVDYKTNALGPLPAPVERFDQAAMAAEMIRDHYPLQALMYAVALHRYLTWRLQDYRPEQHLGAVHYLFVRGMAGPDTPAGCGVFTWHPPAELIVALSKVLAGRP